MAENTDTLQKQVDEQTTPMRKKFGTFAGVFTPTLLTILGVIMYLREGWVVGNAGLLGAWLIILLAFAITVCTGLSMSSITTNIRIGAGGAYSIISQSLGIEVGGSLGIPLYVSQALAVAMYVFGFREGWLYIFPNHPTLIVDFGTFFLLFGIASISTGFAFRIQYVIMAIILASLVSIFGTVFTGAMTEPITWWGQFPGAPENNFQGVNFWVVFAVFFPAATGIMAGANMSGDLANPRRAIPLGTMSAIGLSLLIYMAIAYWLARVATMEELAGNYTIMLDRSLWSPIVLAGLLGATFSSGLSSLIGAPRILQALGTNKILPGGGWFSRITASGEPRNALWLTSAIVMAALLLRDLNAIAPLITMFFLITYAMINVVVLIEQSLGLISFRPLMRVPRIVPLIGTIGCFGAMFIVNPIFSLISIIIVVVFYGILLRRQLINPFQDVRSGLFVSLAEWAAKRVAEMPKAQQRAWKPNLLVPVEDASDLRGMFNFIKDIAHPKGSVKLVGLAMKDAGIEGRDILEERLPQLAEAFRQGGVFATATIIDAEHYGKSVLAGMQSLSGAFFRPNIILLQVPKTEDIEREAEIRAIIAKAKQSELGVLLFTEHEKARLGRRQIINIWVRDQSPNWRLTMELGNLDLSILVSYQLNRDWKGKLHLISAVTDAEQIKPSVEFLTNLVELARIPYVEVMVKNSDFDTCLKQIPQADLNIFGLPDEIDFEFMRRMVVRTSSTCVFVRDSGDENALA